MTFAIKRAAFAALAGISVFLLPVVGSEFAYAKNVKCTKKQVSVPDERPAGGNLCVSKKEWNKAKTICAKNGESDPKQCLCQDGGSVGACGD